MFKVVTIEDKQIPMKSSGRTSRLYTRYFGSDLLNDLFKLSKLEEGDGSSAVLEQIAWTMAKTVDSNIPDIEEWMEQFNDPMAIYLSAQDVLSLVISSTKHNQTPKKKRKSTKR